jgi:hypothetical protein
MKKQVYLLSLAELRKAMATSLHKLAIAAKAIVSIGPNHIDFVVVD